MDFYIITSGNLNSLDGASRFCKILCGNMQYWRDRGVTVTPVSNSGTYQDEREYTSTIYYRIKQKIKELLNRTKMGKNIAFFNYDIKTLGRRAVDQLPEDVDSMAWFLLNDFKVAANFYKRYGDKYHTIFMMHNGGELLSMLRPMMESKKIEVYLKNLEKTIYANATKIIFVSSHAYDIFVKLHPDYEKKCDYIYNGIEDFGFDVKVRDYSKLKLVTVGTICDRKNQFAAIEAIHNMKEKNIEFTLVGGGPMYQACCDYITENGLSGRIKMIGPKTDIKPFLQEANAFIMTSKDEGLPIAATEALCAALPIIITDVGGCKDLIEDNGILIRPTQNDITKGIKYFTERLNDLENMGSRSRRLYLENFTIRHMLDRYFEMISQDVQ